MPPHFLTVRIPWWLLHDDCPESAASSRTDRVVFYRVGSKAVAQRLLRMFQTNDPKAGSGFLLMHPYASKRLGDGGNLALPVFDVLGGDALDLPARTRFQDRLREIEHMATERKPLRGPFESLVGQYHLQARQWEVDAAEPRDDGLPAEIGVLLDRGDFSKLSDDEYAKLGAWLTANARKHYDGLDPASLERTGQVEGVKKRLREIHEYNAALRSADSQGPRQAEAPKAEARIGHFDSADEHEILNDKLFDDDFVWQRREKRWQRELGLHAPATANEMRAIIDELAISEGVQDRVAQITDMMGNLNATDDMLIAAIKNRRQPAPEDTDNGTRPTAGQEAKQPGKPAGATPQADSKEQPWADLLAHAEHAIAAAESWQPDDYSGHIGSDAEIEMLLMVNLLMKLGDVEMSISLEGDVDSRRQAADNWGQWDLAERRGRRKGGADYEYAVRRRDDAAKELAEEHRILLSDLRSVRDLVSSRLKGTGVGRIGQDGKRPAVAAVAQTRQETQSQETPAAEQAVQDMAMPDRAKTAYDQYLRAEPECTGKDGQADSSGTDTAPPVKTGPHQRFDFAPGQVLFDNMDLGLPTGLAVEVIQKLTNSFGRTVAFSELDPNSERGAASEQLRGAINTIRNALTTHRIPCEIDVKPREGYVIRAAKTPRAPRRKPRRR